MLDKACSKLDKACSKLDKACSKLDKAGQGAQQAGQGMQQAGQGKVLKQGAAFDGQQHMRAQALLTCCRALCKRAGAHKTNEHHAFAWEFMIAHLAHTTLLTPLGLI